MEIYHVVSSFSKYNCIHLSLSNNFTFFNFPTVFLSSDGGVIVNKHGNSFPVCSTDEITLQNFDAICQAAGFR